MNINDVPQHIQHFHIFFSSKLELLKNKLIKDFEDKFNYKVEQYTYEEICNMDHNSEAIAILDNFDEEYNRLIKSSLAEYVELQLDEYNDHKITLDELKNRISWIEKEKENE